MSNRAETAEGGEYEPVSANLEMNFNKNGPNPELGNVNSNSYIPMTPLKPNMAKPRPTCEKRQENWFSEQGFLFSNVLAQGTQAYGVPIWEQSKTMDIYDSYRNCVGSLATECDIFSRNHIFDESVGANGFQHGHFGSLLALAESGSHLPVRDFQIESSSRVDASCSATSSPAIQDVSHGLNLWNNKAWLPEMPLYENSTQTNPMFDLNSPPNASMGVFLSQSIPPQFAPFTPDQTKKAENNINTQSLNLDGRKNQVDTNGGDEIATTMIETEKPNEQHVPKDFSSSAESTQLQEIHNSDKNGNSEIELTKTPEQKPRRRKHRPKVVKEGQPKKSPKPANSKPDGPKETPTGKRKYVRKNKLSETPCQTPVAEAERANTEPKTSPATEKSCRRALNFDLESEVREECNACSESQAQNFSAGGESKSTVQLSVANELTGSMKKVLEEFEEYVSAPDRQAINPQTPEKTARLEREVMVNVPNDRAKGKCQIVFSDKTHDMQGSNTTVMESIETQSAARSQNSLSSGKLAKGLKRRNIHNDGAELNCKNVIGSHFNSSSGYIAMFPENSCNGNGLSMHFTTIYKKKRSEKINCITTSSSGNVVNTSGTSGKQAALYSSNCIAPCATACKSIGVTPSIDTHRKEPSVECGLGVDHTGKMKKRSKGSTQVRDYASLMGIVESGPTGKAPICGNMQAYAETCVTMKKKKRTKRLYVTTSTSTGATQLRPSTMEEITELLESLDINSASNRFQKQDKKALVPFNFRFEDHNALVLYQQDGNIVPFEGVFDPVRKRKPRPRVDLDEETTRVWKLLLENINSEGINGTDEEKVKWWEEERRVFQGRADSFIARMHLVQGDRRFSPWKGSVLDSVIGVFLTQNVSDHLSSSAFMSLAARFPLNSKSSSMPSDEGTTIVAEDVCILDPEDTMKWQNEKSNSSVTDMTCSKIYDKSCITGKEVVDSIESIGRSSTNEKSIDNMKSNFLGIFGKGLEIDDRTISNRETLHSKDPNESSAAQIEADDALSSQNSASSPKDSVTSSVAQTSARTGLSLWENMEAGLRTRSNSNNVIPSFVELLQMAEISHGYEQRTEMSSYREDAFMTTEGSKCDMQREQKDGLDNPKAPLRPILPSSNSDRQHSKSEETRVDFFEIVGAENYNSEQSGLTAESVSQVMVQKSTSSKLLIGHSKDNIQSERESTNIINITKSTEHKEVESSLKAINGRISDSSKPRERTRKQKQKQSAINWDSLRLQAQGEGKRTKKTVNTMDSLDWEAVRCADVNEIADTIKERGMNFVLAERIKDFLNRLVKEHGSIDLEWLRDVPPDQAKEYLLSVRGLGLKSVECVRLLTLHHLAFPVDTNVGRIAVRLGWVPLQPLPESLQLHLLELYPVLESIQRYLWPRLCKLDQRTLYELHYQMITFGKVFCTKSKPNCNACPMRGECRHFASAFASARLALPGSEEKSIVSATDSKTTYQNQRGTINHLYLPLPQPDQQLQAQSQSICVPIVEVPASPEPIVEVPTTPELIPEADIEDAFCEDPEEIPTIKLNVEQFAQTLQNYMHKNMELQEFDVSKALVALTPDVASIPTPKLKNVNRLRTEHQVYELPDSHPLLEGLDRREPDDPCSYLLAIWTPGETANSITPPEGKCKAQELGELCDTTTCFSCNSIREANSQTVRGTLLIPCRTAMRGSFPLNGTYFQVNEVFADHDSSINPIDVPRSWIWNLPRRTVYFGTSIPSIFKGLSTESIQYCFWRGFVCVRGFDSKSRGPRPLMARLHFPASKLPKTQGKPS